MRSVFALFTAVIAFAVAGCGGGGSSSSAPSASPFAGNYQGTNVFNNGTGTETSSVNVTVATNGSLTGSYLVTAESGSITGVVGQQGSVTGTITDAGNATIVSTPNGSSTGSSASGTLAFASNGHLHGTLTYPNGTSTGDLVKQ